MAEEVGTEVGSYLFDIYNAVTSSLPASMQEFITFFTVVLLVVIYSIFVWKFYHLISTKNILKLNLNQYNRYEYPIFAKFVAGMFFFLEYMVILPFLIFFWFSVLTIFLIFLTENLEVGALLLISATVIAAIRMTTYYKEDLATDIAKLIPFTLLSISITNPDFFSLERIFGQFSQMPIFINKVPIYLMFIVVLEVILRGFDFVFSLFDIGDEPVESDIKKPREEN